MLPSDLAVDLATVVHGDTLFAGPAAFPWPAPARLRVLQHVLPPRPQADDGRKTAYAVGSYFAAGSGGLVDLLPLRDARRALDNACRATGRSTPRGFYRAPPGVEFGFLTGVARQFNPAEPATITTGGPRDSRPTVPRPRW
ncbi:MAG TPA: hypothetical protein VF629_03635 [Hymenobacter sp.]|jgi:hypothetical protein|uniref:hypothetical protein n=1 Tax=Hymenobacter sp. TaxID=1898978 RepID=UPI002ED834DE